MISLEQNETLQRLAMATGGHNSGDDPVLLGENQFAMGKNVTTRGGRINSRPRFVKRMDLPSGKYQGAKYFKVQDKLCYMSEARLYVLNPLKATSTEVTGFSWESSSDRVWFEEVGEELVLQNGFQYPLAFDGQQVRSLKDITPVGTCMRFANNRLHLASSGKRKDLRIGDIYQPSDRDSALKFTEATYLFGGGSISMPDPITSMMEIRVMDNASGQGSMIIGTKRNTLAIRTEITQRDLWPTVQGFQTTILPNIGVSGPLAMCQVNNDIYLRSPSGFRSLRLAVGELNTPGYGGLHQEAPEYFKEWGTENSSTVYFDNRVLTTVNPKRVQGRLVYDGLIAVNFEGINRLAQKSPPAFDGYWDGLVFRELISAGRNLYAVVVGASGDELWELLPSGSEFSDEPDLWQYVDTRSFIGNDVGSLKALARVDCWLSRITSDVYLEVSYRKDGDNGFTPWYSSSITQVEGSGDYNPTPIKNDIRRVTLTEPPSPANAFGFQFRIAWKGRCQIDTINTVLRHLEESDLAENESFTLGEDDTQYDTRHHHQPSLD